MQSGYGPALVLGVLIGGAILLDDVITPERDRPPPRMAMFHHGDGEVDLKTLRKGEDHNIWVIKTNEASEHEIHQEVKIQLESDDVAAESQELMISVSIDASDKPAGDLAAAVTAVVETARAEGREPTEAEIKAAVTAAIGQVDDIDIEIQSD